jgi:hypothetical protein
MKLFRIHVQANVYNGKYFDYRTIPVNVLATTEQKAIDLMHENKNAVLAHLRTMKVNGRHVIPFKQSPEKNVFFKEHRQYRVSTGYHPYGIIHTRALCRDGRFVLVNAESDGSVEFGGIS